MAPVGLVLIFGALKCEAIDEAGPLTSKVFGSSACSSPNYLLDLDLDRCQSGDLET